MKFALDKRKATHNNENVKNDTKKSLRFNLKFDSKEVMNQNAVTFNNSEVSKTENARKNREAFMKSTNDINFVNKNASKLLDRENSLQILKKKGHYGLDKNYP